MSDASNARAAAHRDPRDATVRRGHRARASRAGPDAPDRYKSDGLEPGSRGELWAFQGAEHPERERSAWPDAPAAPPYRRAAEPPDARQVALPNSVSRADATVHHCLVLPAAARRLPAWVGRRDAEASEWWARQRPAGARPASSSWSEARDELTQPVGSATQYSIPARAWERRSPVPASAGAGPKESGRAGAAVARRARESRVHG